MRDDAPIKNAEQSQTAEINASQRVRGATVLTSTNMLDVKPRPSQRVLRNTTILAAIACPLPYELPEQIVHR